MKKKLLCVFLSIGLLLAALAACQSAPNRQAEGSGLESASATESAAPSESQTSAGEPEEGEALRVLVDLQFALEYYVEGATTQLSDYNIRNALRRAGNEVDFAFEYLPKSGAERDNALDHMRVEIMAGKGPDVFLLASAGMAGGMPEALFRYPAQMMKRHAFLPLDEYIKEAQFMEWDKLIPEVMEAGRNEEGQQLLPLAYSLPVTLFDAQEVQHEHSKTMTFQEMAESSDPALRLAAAWPRRFEERTYRQAQWRMESLFPQLADYDAEELAFTEEELLAAIETQQELAELWNSGDRPAAFQERLYAEMGQEADSASPYHEGIANPVDNDLSNDRAYTMIPLYNTQGGCTAVVTCYGAVNRNTQEPEAAFRILDYILSKECMGASFYEKIYTYGLPVHRELMQPGQGIPGMGVKFALSQENYEELESLWGSITGARFRDQLDVEMEELSFDVHFRENSWTPEEEWESLEDLVKERYWQMEMGLAES